MKLHYMGKYNLDPESLPRGEHMPGAAPFQEVEDTRQMSLIANGASAVLIVLLGILAAARCRLFLWDARWQLPLGCAASMLALFPHELLHAVCFKKDAYLYTNWAQGLLFVVGPETMSKARFIFMSLLPNLVFGFVPYVIGMIWPRLIFCLAMGTLCIGMGAGDYYNVFNAATQMPKGSRTYLYGFHSWWYMPQ